MAGSTIIEIFAHMDVGDRRQWNPDQDTRPLSELGQHQAARLSDELARQPIHALYSSAALRARQSLEPLAQRFGLPVIVLPGLHETDSWLPPPRWRNEQFPANDPLGGAYAAGLAMKAIETIRAKHSTGRVVACTHGDVLPSLICYLIGSYDQNLPSRNKTRGGWYTLVLEGDSIDVQHHDILPNFPL